MAQKEYVIERYLKSRSPGLIYKFASPGTRGVPDRIIIYNSKVYFVELKDKNGKLSAMQKKVISDFKGQGVHVYVISSKEEVDEFITEISGEGCSTPDDK